MKKSLEKTTLANTPRPSLFSALPEAWRPALPTWWWSRPRTAARVTSHPARARANAVRAPRARASCSSQPLLRASRRARPEAGSLEFVGVGSREHTAPCWRTAETRAAATGALARFWVSHLDEHFDALRAERSARGRKDGGRHTWTSRRGVSRNGSPPSGAVACVTAARSPAMLRHDVRAPVLPPSCDCLGSALSRNAPKPRGACTTAVDRASSRRFERRRVFSGTQDARFKNALASSREFTPARGIYATGSHAAEAIAMWPPWFGAPPAVAAAVPAGGFPESRPRRNAGRAGRTPRGRRS